MVEVTEIGESPYMTVCTESQVDYMCYTDSVNPDLDDCRASDRSFAAVASQRHRFVTLERRSSVTKRAAIVQGH